jgi:fructokinase
MTAQAGAGARVRIGIDLGGSKIAGAALAGDGRLVAEHRRPAPRGDYAATLAAIADVVALLEGAGKGGASVGIGIPGSLSQRTGLVQNANSTWLNGRPLARDLEEVLVRPVRLANDANCFALSEARDGAGAGEPTVFGVILGTGCGGGLVINGILLDGPRGIAGEWGHNPLPWAAPDEHPGPACWCGRMGCMETWVSGPALAADHQRTTGAWLAAEAIAAAAAAGSGAALATLERHARRLARGLAGIINVLDPSVIVLGGGLCKLQHLYGMLPALIAPYVLGEPGEVAIKPPRWGDASGVRGAAWLWEGR